MRSDGVFVDASLLVLLVVGQTGRHLIERHRRLRTFAATDYDTLLGFISRFDRLFVMPNTLTEASNLLAHHREPQRSEFFRTLRYLIERGDEVVVASTKAAGNTHFERLGLTDAALLERVSPDAPLLTVDLDLFLQANRGNPGSAVNFRHYQDPQD